MPSRFARWLLLLALIPLLLGVVWKRFPDRRFVQQVDVWPDVGAEVGEFEELAPDDAEQAFQWGLANGTTCVDDTSCFLGPCEDNVDEPPSTPDGNIVATATDNAVTRFSFPTPSSTPLTGTDEQAFEVTMTRVDDCNVDAGGDDPTYDVNMLCDGLLRRTVATGVPVTGLDQNLTHPWTMSPLCDADGSDVEIQIRNHDGGGTIRDAAIEAVEWEKN